MSFDGEVETHPSWLLVSASRVSGHNRLFQSDIVHQHFIRVRVARARRQRDLHRDWVTSAASADLMEFDMSLSQWAEFLTTLNVGQGVPATLKYLNGERVEQEEDPERRIDLTAKEVRAKSKTVLDPVNKALDKVEAVLDANGGKRALRDALDSLRHAVNNVPSNMAFAAKSLDEHAEQTVAHAKAEIDAMAVSLRREAELAAAEAWGRYTAQGGVQAAPGLPMLTVGDDDAIEMPEARTAAQDEEIPPFVHTESVRACPNREVHEMHVYRDPHQVHGDGTPVYRKCLGVDLPKRPIVIPRRHPDAPGECMECGAELDPQAIITECCMACHSDQIRVYAEEDED